MSKTVVDIHADFAGIVGDSQVMADTEGCAAFAVDGAIPKCVVYVSSAEQVAEVLRFAGDRDLAVIPSRSRTKLGVGAPPNRYDVALCLKDMNQVWYYEPDDLVMSVGPGMKFGDLQHFLSRHKLWLPLDPAGGERASVGGILATNSAGPLRLRYGAPRDMVLGLKVATVEGKIIKTGGRVVKNVAGYDLGKLLIGSYGTLGVIVEATFKLYPQVAERDTWMIEPGTLAAAREFRQSLLRSPLRPLRAVLLDGPAAALLNPKSKGNGAGPAPEIRLEAGGSPRVMARYSDELGRLASGIGPSIQRAEDDEVAAWDSIADFGLYVTREGRFPIVLKASLPIAAGEEFLERAGKEAHAANCQAAGLVQLGVGVVELALRAAEGAQFESRAAGVESRVPGRILIESLRQLARDLGGSLTIERCPPELKSQVDVWGPAADDFDVMRKLKAAWDPKGTLAPGRFVGGI
jgi:glycolate dehydrogenase FAD-binding subunit